jgi:HEAT repeat protein
MNDTIRSIVGMLSSEQPELRVAAAQVLGELGVKDAGLVRSLAAVLQRSDGHTDRHVLSALAKIGSVPALRCLTERLGEPGPVADLICHLLSQAGAPAQKVIAESFEDASVGAQRQMIGILGRHPGKESIAVFEKALATPELAAAAAQGLGACLSELTPKSAKALGDRLTKIADDDGSEPAAAAQAIDLLARLDANGHRAVLVRCASPGRPSMVRRAALDSLRGVKLTPSQLATLIGHLAEDDAIEVVDSTTRLLADVDSFPEKVHGVLVGLLDRKIPALQEFAIRALARVDSEDVAGRLLPLLFDSNSTLRNAAAVALGSNPAAIGPLVKALQKEKERARAERIAGPVAAHAEDLDTKRLGGLVDRGIKLLLAQDAVGEVILLTLLRARGADVADIVVDKAVRLRRAKTFEDAALLLMFVAQAGKLSSEGKYQLALTRLLIDGERAPADNAHSRGYTPSESGDATMGYFVALVREGFPVYDRLRKESMVKPEMLLRIAEHFADGVGSDRRFGTELLHHIAQKHGKKRVGEEAHALLRGASL